MKIIKYNAKTLDFESPKDFFEGIKIKGSKGKYWFKQYNKLLDDYNNLEQKYKELLNDI